MQILLTGASGFIAHWIAKELNLTGHHVTGVVRKANSSSKYCRDEIIVNDIFVPDSPILKEKLLTVDAVIHCAWYVNPEDYVTSVKNFECYFGTLQLAKLCIECKVKSFVGIGTCFEYYLDGKSILQTNTKLMPNTPYGAAKLATFLGLREIFDSTSTNFLWARLFYLFGENENADRLFGLIRRNIGRGQTVNLGPCNVYRDYLEVGVAAKIIVDCLNNSIFGVHNICSGEAKLLKDLVIDYANELNGLKFIQFNTNNINKPNSNLERIYGNPSYINDLR